MVPAALDVERQQVHGADGGVEQEVGDLPREVVVGRLHGGLGQAADQVVEAVAGADDVDVEEHVAEEVAAAAAAAGQGVDQVGDQSVAHAEGGSSKLIRNSKEKPYWLLYL